MPMVIPAVAAALSISAATLITGMAIAGTALSAIGAITGNKTLSMFGGVIGLVGGVAGIAASLGTTGASAAALGEAAAASSTGSLSQTAAVGTGLDLAASEALAAAPGALDAASAIGAAAEPLSATALATDGVVNAAASMAPDVGMIGGEMAAAATSAPDSSLVTELMQAPAPGMDPAAAADAAAPAAEPAGYQSNSADKQAIFGGENYGSKVEPSFGSRVGDAVSGATDWMGRNKQATNLIGGMINGAAKSYGDQSLLKEKYKLDEQASARQRARLNASVQGLKMPVYQRSGA